MTATRRSRPRRRRAAIGDPVRPRAARPRGRDPADRAHALGARARRAAVDGAAPGARARRARAARSGARARAQAARRARTGASSDSPPIGSRPPAPGSRGAYDDAAELAAPTSTCCSARSTRGGAPRLACGRAAAPALAGGDVRLPPRGDGGAAALERARRACGAGAEAAERARARPLARAKESRRPALDRRDPRGARDVPGDRRHPAAVRRRRVRPRDRELHALGRRPRRRAARSRASRCPRRPPEVRAGAAARVAARARDRDRRILDAWLALPEARRLLRRRDRRARGHGRLLRFRQGSRHARREPRAVPGAARDGRVGTRARRAPHDLPRARRGARARRRPGQPARSSAQPPGSVDGRFTVTEQGEVAFARYGDPALARRHLEQLTNAVVRASADRRRAATPPTASTDEIELMAEVSRTHYERPRARRRLRRVLPAGHADRADRRRCRSRHGRSHAASTTPTTLDDLRAIPWVFAWGQSRVNLHRVVRARRRARGGRRRDAAASRRCARCRATGRSSPRCSRTPSCRSRRPTPRSPSCYLAARRPRRPRRRRSARRWRAPPSWCSRSPGTPGCSTAAPTCSGRSSYRNPYVDALSFLQLRFLDDASGRDGATRPGDDQRGRSGLQNTG